MTKQRLFVGIGSVTVIVAFSAPSRADVPLVMTEQGRVFDTNNNPVAGSVAFSFAIYNAPTGGTALWSEVEPSLTLDSGFFSEVLGKTTPLTAAIFQNAAAAATPLYLGITVGTDPEMTPRQPLSTVPFAFLASNVVGDITPHSISVNGVEVISPDGGWVGPNSGLQGPTGPTGPTGTDGMVGATGPTGPAGTGLLGPTGPAGVSSVGATGATGPTGATGAAGPGGTMGLQETYGFTVPAGTTFITALSFNTGAGTHCLITAHAVVFGQTEGYIYPQADGSNGSEFSYAKAVLGYGDSEAGPTQMLIAVSPNTTHTAGCYFYSAAAVGGDCWASAVCF